MGNLFKNVGHLFLNYLYDMIVFIRYSGVFKNNTDNKVLGKIVYFYHSVEKGLINDPIRFKFGKAKISYLLKFLHLWVDSGYYLGNSQFIAGCSVLIKYHQYHNDKKVDISDIISDENMQFLYKYANNQVGGALNMNSAEYFNNRYDAFDLFSNSRHSVRHYNGEIVDIEKIENAISIARNAPSVCNRQSTEVFLIDNEDKAQKIFKVQSGMNATSKNLKQVLVVTSQVGAFVSPVERNQMFVDGGIFLQNLLYSLHFYGIAACALNWSKPFFYEREIRKYFKISHCRKIICVVAIGYPINNFKVPFSKRKDVSEILNVIN